MVDPARPADDDPLGAVVDRLAAVASGPDEGIPLDEAALCIAAAHRPDLDVDGQLARIDALADRVVEPTLEGVLGLLFDRLGFAGDTVDYYAPVNSELDRVLDRRRGIPVTLSVVVMEVARRVGVDLVGIGMPGHFLVRERASAGRYVDPYGGGAILDPAGCRRRFAGVHGVHVPFHPSYLEPVPRLAIVSRVLSNLENLAAGERDHEGMVALLRLRAALPTSGPAEAAALDAVRAVADRRN